MKLRPYLDMSKQAASAWVDDRASSMGAALSYYTVFSIAPLLLIVISVAGLVFGREAAEGAIVAQLSGLLGQRGATLIQEALRSVSAPKQGVINTVIGLVLVLAGATTVFGELQDDLNRIWKAPRGPAPSGIWGWVRARLLSVGMILAIGFLLLVSLAASAAISALGSWSFGWLAHWEALAHAIDILFSYAVGTALFAMIYRFMPQVHIRWHDVWIGAAVTGLLFAIGKSLIGLYIGKSAVASGFGAAGSLAVLLVWVYYSAQIFLLGAEFTWVYANQFGSHKNKPAPAREQQGAGQVSAKPAKPEPAEGSAPTAPSGHRDVRQPARQPVLQTPRGASAGGGGWKQAGLKLAASIAVGAAGVVALRKGVIDRHDEPWRRLERSLRRAKRRLALG